MRTHWKEGQRDPVTALLHLGSHVREAVTGRQEKHKSKQILCWPVCHGLSSSHTGWLQTVNLSQRQAGSISVYLQGEIPKTTPISLEPTVLLGSTVLMVE